MIIHLMNLPDDATENGLVDEFSKYGKVDKISIVRDKFSDAPRGEGFIDMPDKEEAEAAMKAFNGKVFLGCPLVVKPAHQQSFHNKWHVDGKQGRLWHNRNTGEARLKEGK